MTTWMITVKQPYCGLLLSGEKKMELRKSIPSSFSVGDRLLVVEKGTGGVVVAEFIVDEVIHADWRFFCQDDQFFLHRVARIYIEKYSKHRTLYGIILREPTLFYPELRFIEEYDVWSVPQWFTRVY